jgi:hypothetical protein
VSEDSQGCTPEKALTPEEYGRTTQNLREEIYPTQLVSAPVKFSPILESTGDVKSIIRMLYSFSLIRPLHFPEVKVAAVGPADPSEKRQARPDFEWRLCH